MSACAYGIGHLTFYGWPDPRSRSNVVGGVLRGGSGCNDAQRSVVKVSDFYSARQWHSTGMYTDHDRPLGFEHYLMLNLPEAPPRAAGPGRYVRLTLARGPGPDFSEGDRALLTLVRPHLHQAYLDAERRRHPVPQLTARHWDLLRLLAAGHTNAQIARRLSIS